MTQKLIEVTYTAKFTKVIAVDVPDESSDPMLDLSLMQDAICDIVPGSGEYVSDTFGVYYDLIQPADHLPTLNLEPGDNLTVNEVRPGEVVLHGDHGASHTFIW